MAGHGVKYRMLIGACAALWAASAGAEAVSPPDKETESVIVTGRQLPDDPANRIIDDALGQFSTTAVTQEIAADDSEVALRVIATALNGTLGEWYEWHGVHGGEGRFRPTQEYQSRGLLCRDFTMQTSLNDKVILGSACRQADGWHIR